MKTVKALLLMLSGVCAVVQAQTSQPSWQIEPGVILDENRGQVYVMRDGGVEALALESGASIWRSSQADLPSGIVQNQLLSRVDRSQAGELGLVLLNPENGALLQQYSVPLPDTALASINHGLGREFEVLLNGQNIDWAYRNQQIKGRLELALSAPVLDGGSGQTSPVQAANPVERRFGRLQLEDDLSAIRIIGESNQQSFSSRPADLAVNVLSGERGRQFRSVSSRSVLVSERSDDESDVRYEWRVFDRNGRFIGEVAMPYSFLPFELSDHFLLVVMPPELRTLSSERQSIQPSLRVIDLRQGKIAWQQTIRDIQYRGPYPH